MKEEKLNRIEKKLDLLLNSNKHSINEKKYITAREVEDLTGLNYRTILNRSNLDRDHHLHIPSIQFGKSRSKYFERKVIKNYFASERCVLEAPAPKTINQNTISKKSNYEFYR